MGPSRRGAVAGFVALVSAPGSVALGRDAVGEAVESSWPIAAEVAARVRRPLGNVTITPEGRRIVSHHPLFETMMRVSEIVGEDGLAPFPNLAWNAPLPLTDRYLDSVLGLRSDAAGVVWMLDMGTRGGIEPKLVAWDTRRDTLHALHRIGAACIPASKPNDLVLHPAGTHAFIADEGTDKGADGTRGALIAVDLRDGSARRLLEGHASTAALDLPPVVDGRPLAVTEADGSAHPLTVGADGIAVDHAGEWLYWGPMSARTLYRARTRDLLDPALSTAELGARVEAYAGRPVAGGMSIDAAGNLYLTEVGAGFVGVIPAGTRTYRRYATHPDMAWPDGFAAGPDGALYLTASQLPTASALRGRAGNADTDPHLLFRLPLLAPGRVGH